MNRRSFFAALLATATLDPERLLWTPGKKLISIPKPGKTIVHAGDVITINFTGTNILPYITPQSSFVAGKKYELVSVQYKTALAADTPIIVKVF